MSFVYEPKSTTFSLLSSIKILRNFISFFPNFLLKFFKLFDGLWTFVEAVLFTLFLRFIFDIPVLDIKESLLELINNFSYSNPFNMFVFQIMVIQFLKESINSRIRYRYAFYNSSRLNLEYVSDSIDDELKYYIKEKYKNPSEINILCISGQDTFVNDDSYLHDYIEALEPNGLTINIILSDCTDPETTKSLDIRSKQIDQSKIDYNKQIEDTLNYCKMLLERNIKINFFLCPGIPTFKIVIIDRIVIVQNYASSLNSNKKTVFVISKSNHAKNENNSIFEAYSLYFENKKKLSKRIAIRPETTLVDCKKEN